MPEAPVRQAGTILAFDFGVKRIGVAVGEWPLAQAHPLTTIHGEANAVRFAAIEALLKEWRPVSLVVGLPLALDGSAHEMTARSTRFANQLRGRFGLPVDYAEERLSSVEAEGRLRAGGHNAKSAREHVDALAAQIILQCFFERFSEESRNPAYHVA
ncbi:MAG: Holliday junction resolvase RuvX [Propionivibrio sp.]|uniref:Holliday junction resolvase RuvX n=1 Tax=Propionivibrio sp. TaxID=2212460 RepID=UPI001B5EAE91|nr:Holliday junction resolvase RuvX [Propionivibrio sp.]MBP7202188.1 Holliday junction resolvase RuvX [Propionivibrio sp.]